MQETVSDEAREFHRLGAAYRKEQLVIFKVDRVGGRASETIDEEHVGTRLNKSCRGDIEVGLL